MNKKNILLITARSDVGGGPKHVLELAKEIKHKYEHQINLFIASPQDKPHFHSYLQLCQKHFTIPHRSFNLLILIRLVFFCIKNNISIIHSHGRGAGIYSRPLRPLGIRILHSHHGIHPSYKFKNFIEGILDIFTNKHILISKSEYETGVSLNLFSKRKSIIIENGINIEQSKEILLKSSTYEIQKKCHLLKSDIVLATLSRLDEHKGNILLLKKFLFLVTNDSFHNYKLLIAGEGEEKNNLEAFISDNNLSDKVYLIGNIGNPFELLKTANLYVSHSKGEGLPYSVLEAFLSGLPCLLSDVPGHQGIVDKDQLFKNKEEFTSKLKNIMDKGSYGEANRENLDKNFSLHKQVKKLITLYL